MAILKPITLSNGIVLNYHRIAAVNTVTNVQTSIEIQSYISEEARLQEKDWYETTRRYNTLREMPASELTDDEKLFIDTHKIEPMDVFIDSTVYVVDYDPYMNVMGAYNYIKTLPEFEGAIDLD